MQYGAPPYSENSPEAQVVHALDPLTPRCEYLPTAQLEHADAPAEEYQPEPHAVQEYSYDAIVEEANIPAGQVEHDTADGVAAYCPELHVISKRGVILGWFEVPVAGEVAGSEISF